ncbi:MAG: hypothetical protein KBT45_03015, partial [Bacteroidales bacterium]|nr:hypothetical protein [Candidatus Colimorpha pelethequi]
PPHFVLRCAIESPPDFLHVLLAERSIEKKGQRLWEGQNFYTQISQGKSAPPMRPGSSLIDGCLWAVRFTQEKSSELQKVF